MAFQSKLGFSVFWDVNKTVWNTLALLLPYVLSPFFITFFSNFQISFNFFSYYFLLEHLFLISVGKIHQKLARILRTFSLKRVHAKHQENMKLIKLGLLRILTQTDIFLVVKSQTCWLREWKQRDLFAVSTLLFSRWEFAPFLLSFTTIQDNSWVPSDFSWCTLNLCYA